MAMMPDLPEVNYDSWLDSEPAMTREMFRWLGSPLTSAMRRQISAHFTESRPGYLSTHRGRAWPRDRWRGQLSPHQLHWISKHCDLPPDPDGTSQQSLPNVLSNRFNRSAQQTGRHV